MSVGTEMRQDRLAIDRAPTARSFDEDGHMHVKGVPISKANVCGYYGREIPEADKLGLDPNRIYQLYRDPDELAKGADTFNGKPLLNLHKPQTASDHDHDLTVGSVHNVYFDPPYLRAGDFHVWDGDSISGIDSNEQRELSSSYRYDADMTPGSVGGVQYQGVMRNIRANHVALVSSGRAGPDVIVSDAALPTPSPTIPHNPEITMAKTASVSRQALLASGFLRAYLRPKLANDAKLDITGVLKGVTAKTWEADKPRIKTALDAAVQGKLAQDADIDDLVEVLQALEPVQDLVDGLSTAEVTGSDPDPETGVTDDDSDDDDEAAKLKAAGLTDEEIAAIMKMRAGNSAGTAAAATASDAEPVVTKAAMDAAIAAATTAAASIAARNAKAETVAHMMATQEALRIVQPRIGTINVAMDSASAVYKQAFDTLSIDVAGVPESAYAAFYRALPAPQAEVKASAPRVALDAASVTARNSMFPNATRLAN